MNRKTLREKIHQKTARNRSDSLASIVTELNPIPKGWFGSFKEALRSSFRDVDAFARRHLRAILRALDAGRLDHELVYRSAATILALARRRLAQT